MRSNCGNRHAQASGHDGEQTDVRDDIALPCIKERLTPRNLCLTFPSHRIQSSQDFNTFFLSCRREPRRDSLARKFQAG